MDGAGIIHLGGGIGALGDDQGGGREDFSSLIEAKVIDALFGCPEDLDSPLLAKAHLVAFHPFFWQGEADGLGDCLAIAAQEEVEQALQAIVPGQPGQVYVSAPI